MKRMVSLTRLTRLLLLGVLALVESQTAAAQQVALAERGPRFLLVSAHGRAEPVEIEAGSSALLRQVVGLNLEHPTVGGLLDEISRQTGLTFFYGQDVLSPERPVTLQAESITVATALIGILMDAGVDVILTQGNQVALVRQRPRPAPPPVASIAGRVTDRATSAPIAGATVAVEGKGWSATTKDDGSYRIEPVEPGAYTVRARYIGYASLTVQVSVPEGGEASADFSLMKSAQKLNELVTVTPGGMQTQLKAVPTALSIVTAAQIEQQHATTFNQVLRQIVPSAVGFASPIQPASTPFSLRGASTLSTSGQVKILLDGIEAANSGTSPVDPASIERVEVIRGPQAATVYGPNAAAGVIQIFTKRGGMVGRPEVSLRAEGGLQQTPYPGFKSVARQNIAAAVRGGGGNASYNFGGTYWRLPDWLPNGELSSQSTPSVFGGLRYSEGPITMDLSGRYHVSNTGLALNPELLQAGFVPTSRPQFNPQKFTNQTIGARLGVNPTAWWTNQLSVGIDRSGFESIQRRPRLTTPADTLLFVLMSNSDKTSLSYNTSLRWTPPGLWSATFTAGLDHVRLPADQTLTTQALATQGTIRLAPGGAFSVSRALVTNSGYFVQLEVGLADRLFLTGGLRMDDNSTFGEDLGTPVSPRLGLAYTHELESVVIKARTSYGRAIRSAAPGQAFGNVLPSQITLANPLLGPEQQRGWDGGVDLMFGEKASLSFSGFDQTADDLIAFVQTATEPLPTFQWQNVGRVKNRGLEIEGTLSVSEQLHLTGQYSYVESRIEDLGPSFTGGERVGDATLGIPEHTAGGTLAFSPWPATTLGGGLTYVGSFRQIDQVAQIRCLGNTGPCQPTPRGYIVDFPAFTKLNATISQRVLPQFTAFVAVDNLTNNLAFEGSNGLAVMGRLTTIGVQLRYSPRPL